MSRLGLIVRGSTLVLPRWRSPSGPTSRDWKQHTINGKSEFEAAGVFDVDNDGKLDIVAGDTWYQAPDWKPYHVRDVKRQGTYYNDFATLPLDVNGDGHTDFVTCSYFAKDVGWVENPGKSRRRLVLSRGRRARQHRGGLDGRPVGRRRCLTSCPTRSTWSSGMRLSRRVTAKVLISRSTTWATAAAGHGVGSGDVNGDGRVDLLTPKGWFEAPAEPAHGTWAWHPDWQLGATGIQILARDVDGDGLSDIVYGMGHDYGLFWLHQTKGTGGERTWTKADDRQLGRIGSCAHVGRYRWRRQGPRAGDRQARLCPRDRAGRDRRLADRLVCLRPGRQELGQARHLPGRSRPRMLPRKAAIGWHSKTSRPVPRAPACK